MSPKLVSSEISNVAFELPLPAWKVVHLKAKRFSDGKYLSAFLNRVSCFLTGLDILSTIEDKIPNDLFEDLGQLPNLKILGFRHSKQTITSDDVITKNEIRKLLLSSLNLRKLFLRSRIARDNDCMGFPSSENSEIMEIVREKFANQLVALKLCVDQWVPLQKFWNAFQTCKCWQSKPKMPI